MRAAQAIRTVADDSGAEKRGGIFVGKSWQERVRVGLADQHGFGVAAIGVVSSELGEVAEVLEAAAAIVALSAGVVEPGDADAIACFQLVNFLADRIDYADDLVAGNHRKPG